MITYRKLEHSDYQDIVELCRDIWDGTDYLPELFHGWVDDRGLFLGAIDSETGRVVGTDKYSVLPDGTGWLEGLRVHKNYRGQKIAKELADRILAASKQELQEGKVDKLAFSTHLSAVESIGMMKKENFIIAQQHILVTKQYSAIQPDWNISDYTVEPWDISYEEFSTHPYIMNRDGLLPFVFYFQKPTKELYEELREEKCFIKINGYRGLYKFKGEPHFACFDESFDAIETFMNYYLLKLNGLSAVEPMTSVRTEDAALLDRLKAAGFGSICNWEPDYLYFVYDMK